MTRTKLIYMANNVNGNYYILIVGISMRKIEGLIIDLFPLIMMLIT